MEEDEENLAPLKGLKDSSPCNDGIVRKLGFVPSSDDHISYDSSLDQENLAKLKLKNEIIKAVPSIVYQEDIDLKKNHFDSLQQESLKINPLNTHNYDSKTQSIAMSNGDFKTRKQSNEAQYKPSHFTHSKHQPSGELMEESSKYFIKKTTQPSTKDIFSPKYEESTKRQTIKQSPTEKGIEATYYSAYYDRAQEENDSERTRQKIMLGQQGTKQSTSMASRMRSTEDRYIDYSSKPQIANKYHHPDDSIDKDGPMFTSKYIANPFKETQQEFQFKIPTPTVLQSEVLHPSHLAYKQNPNSSAQNLKRSYQMDQSKFSNHRRPPSDLRLDNTMDYHSASMMGTSHHFHTPKHSILRPDCCRHHVASPVSCHCSHQGRTMAQSSASHSGLARKTDKRKPKLPTTGQNSQGLSRKDVLDILKLHNTLQAKIQFLEGKVSPSS